MLPCYIIWVSWNTFRENDLIDPRDTHDLWGQTVDNFCSHSSTGHSDQVWSKFDQACGKRNELWEEEEEERNRKIEIS